MNSSHACPVYAKWILVNKVSNFSYFSTEYCIYDINTNSVILKRSACIELISVLPIILHTNSSIQLIAVLNSTIIIRPITTLLKRKPYDLSRVDHKFDAWHNISYFLLIEKWVYFLYNSAKFIVPWKKVYVCNFRVDFINRWLSYIVSGDCHWTSLNISQYCSG